MANVVDARLDCRAHLVGHVADDGSLEYSVERREATIRSVAVYVQGVRALAVLLVDLPTITIAIEPKL